MNIDELIATFNKASKRIHYVGTKEAGVLAALDMEGRLFAVLNGEVLNRVNPDAVYGNSFGEVYHNPGGDGLWPAPEGTDRGFQYSTGKWRVPAGIRSARYFVRDENDEGCTIFSEIDLVNNKGIGVPMLFERRITVNGARNFLELNIVERFKYLGNKVLMSSGTIIAPWSLSQFDCSDGCKVVFPNDNNESVWDLYDDTIVPEISVADSLFHVPVNGNKRFQIGIGENVPWIEFQNPHKKLVIRRSAGKLPEHHNYIDIRDASPLETPYKRGVKYSVYCDPNGFMEIEAAGGCPEIIHANLEMSVSVKTIFIKS